MLKQEKWRTWLQPTRFTHLVTEESSSSKTSPWSAMFSLITISPLPGHKPLAQRRRKAMRSSAEYEASMQVTVILKFK